MKMMWVVKYGRHDSAYITARWDDACRFIRSVLEGGDTINGVIRRPVYA